MHGSLSLKHLSQGFFPLYAQVLLKYREHFSPRLTLRLDLYGLHSISLVMQWGQGLLCEQSRLFI